MGTKRALWVVGLAGLAAAGSAIGQEGTQPGNRPSQPPGQTGRERDPIGRGAGIGQGLGLGQDKVTQQDLDRFTASWPEASKKALREMTGKYGLPSAATNFMVAWKDNGPWKFTSVMGMETPHNFPQPHTDVLMQCVGLRVPVEKVGDLARFDGSIVVNRTAGFLSACCDTEANNFIALNLAHEIITGSKQVDEARQQLAQEVANAKQGKTSAYSQGLMFQPDRGQAGDPDRPVTTLGTITPGITPDLDKDKDKDTLPPGITPRIEPGKPGSVPRPSDTPPSPPPR